MWVKQRKKQPAVTRQLILDAAGEEFSVHGYAGAGLNAVVERAGLTKGALFHHFADKLALARGWVGEVLGVTVAKAWVDPLDGVASLDAWRAVYRASCMALEEGDGLGTLVLFVSESGGINVSLKGDLEEIFTDWRQAIARLLERGQREGWIHRSIQPAVEAAFLVSTICGFSVINRLAGDGSGVRMCVTGLEAYLETLRAQG